MLLDVQAGNLNLLVWRIYSVALVCGRVGVGAGKARRDEISSLNLPYRTVIVYSSGKIGAGPFSRGLQ